MLSANACYRYGMRPSQTAHPVPDALEMPSLPTSITAQESTPFEMTSSPRGSMQRATPGPTSASILKHLPGLIPPRVSRSHVCIKTYFKVQFSYPCPCSDMKWSNHCHESKLLACPETEHPQETVVRQRCKGRTRHMTKGTLEMKRPAWRWQAKQTAQLCRS